MNAIVYTTNTGNTQKYAQLLGEKTGLPVYSASDSHESDVGGIIYMGWIMAGTVSGLGEAVKKYDVQAVCAVGMMPETTEKMINELTEKNQISVPFFYLPGGFSIKKLSGMYKLMMGMMSKKLKSEIKAKSELTKADEAMLKMFDEGVDFVDEKNLQPVLDALFSA